MKFIHVYATPDGESHWEPLPIEFLDGGRRTDLQAATSIRFIQRETNDYMEPHPVGQPQYVLYLSVRVEIGLSDGTTVINEPGDVMFVEDTHGKGHTSRTLQGGVCAFVPLALP